ncbi:hypothetical protein DIPPA_20626 [Diplonema papillatum]|nr:hypothetical protein DIPPA_20626 [Diplonema papillatum]
MLQRHNPYAFDESFQQCSASSVASVEELTEDSGEDADQGAKFDDDYYIQTVGYKHGRTEDVWVAKRDNVNQGDHVIVEVDRGFTLGVACGAPKAAGTVLQAPPVYLKVLRHADGKEVHYWTTGLVELETRAKASAQNIFSQHRIPAAVASTELQFDRRKLTIYYSSHLPSAQLSTAIPDLFRMFNTRITFSQVARSDTPASGISSPTFSSNPHNSPLTHHSLPPHTHQPYANGNPDYASYPDHWSSSHTPSPTPPTTHLQPTHQPFIPQQQAPPQPQPQPQPPSYQYTEQRLSSGSNPAYQPAAYASPASLPQSRYVV